MDRDDTLRRAEKLLRQGRLEAAIAEYARLVEDSPRDWNTANILGDLYVRAGQIDQAVGHYSRIAEHLAREGFVSKATALYKKIVKIRPDDEAALLRTAELSASQGLMAEARVHLRALFEYRTRRGDRPGAVRAAAALADLDPGDAAARAEIARLVAGLGDAAGAAAHFRAAGQSYLATGKTDLALQAWREGLALAPGDEAISGDLVESLLGQGDLDGAQGVAKTAAHWRAVAAGLGKAGREDEACAALERVLRDEPADVPARVQLARSALLRHDSERARGLLAPVADSRDAMVEMALAEIEFRTGSVEVGRAALQRSLAGRAELVEPAITLACEIARTAPDKGYAVIGVVVEDAEAAGDTDAALQALERLLAAAPGHVPALEEYIRICGQGFYEHQRYRAQVQLADAYLAHERWQDARTLAEHLATARPDDAAHARRLARAEEGLAAEVTARAAREPAPDVPAPSRGQGDFGPRAAPRSALVEDASMADVAGAPEVWVMPEPRPAHAPVAPPASSAGAASWSDGGDASLETVIEFTDDLLADDGGVSAGEAEPDVFEIDLSGEIDELMAAARQAVVGTDGATPAAGAVAAEHPRGLEGYFEDLREQRGRDLESAGAALAYDRASEHVNRGELDDAEACLRTAARDPLIRFRAASMLARIARDRGRLAEAVEWLERASEAPAPSEDASRGLLYELADTLQSAGEEARALAVFIELASSAPGYRDVGERVARLTGRPGDGRGPWGGRR